MKRSHKTLLLGLVMLTLAACSKVSAENYEKVEAGMQRAEVYKILGKPDDVSGTAIGKLEMSTETWDGRDNKITITFAGDKVTLKNIAPREK